MQRGQDRLSALLDDTTEKATPEIVNMDAVGRLLEAAAFPHAGRVWHVPSVPFKIGCALMKAQLRVKEIGKYSASGMLVDEYETECEKIADLIFQVAQPVGGWSWRERIARRFGWLKNPFRDAAEGDLGAIMTFCSTRRMTLTASGRAVASTAIPSDDAAPLRI